MSVSSYGSREVGVNEEDEYSVEPGVLTPREKWVLEMEDCGWGTGQGKTRGAAVVRYAEAEVEKKIRYIGGDWSGLVDTTNQWERDMNYRGTNILVKDRVVDGQVQQRYLVGGYTSKMEKQFWEIGSWDICTWLGGELERLWVHFGYTQEEYILRQMMDFLAEKSAELKDQIIVSELRKRGMNVTQFDRYGG